MCISTCSEQLQALYSSTHVWRIRGVGEGKSSERLTSSKRRQRRVVRAARSVGVAIDFTVKGRGDDIALLVVVVEVLDLSRHAVSRLMS